MLRLVLLLAVLAAAVYAVFWLIDRRNKGLGGGDGGSKPISRGPVGPDDDEDFLRQLERRSRHARELEAKGRSARDPGSTAGPTPAEKRGVPGDPPSQQPSGDGTSASAPSEGRADAQDTDDVVAKDPPVGGPLNGSPNGRPADRVKPPEQPDEDDGSPDDVPRDESRRGSRRGTDSDDNATDDDET